MVRIISIEITDGRRTLELVTDTKVRVVGRRWNVKGNYSDHRWASGSEWRICGGIAE